MTNGNVRLLWLRHRRRVIACYQRVWTSRWLHHARRIFRIFRQCLVLQACRSSVLAIPLRATCLPAAAVIWSTPPAYYALPARLWLTTPTKRDSHRAFSTGTDAQHASYQGMTLYRPEIQRMLWRITPAPDDARLGLATFSSHRLPACAAFGASLPVPSCSTCPFFCQMPYAFRRVYLGSGYPSRRLPCVRFYTVTIITSTGHLHSPCGLHLPCCATATFVRRNSALSGFAFARYWQTPVRTTVASTAQSPRCWRFYA